MRTIFKYRLQVTDVQTIEVPRLSTPVLVACRGGDLNVWMEVPDTDAPTVTRIIWVFGTGHEMPLPGDDPLHRAGDNLLPFGDELFHVGSALMLDGMLVWHVYEQRTATG